MKLVCVLLFLAFLSTMPPSWVCRDGYIWFPLERCTTVDGETVCQPEWFRQIVIPNPCTGVEG